MSDNNPFTQGSEGDMGAPPFYKTMVPASLPCKHWTKDDCEKLGVFFSPQFIVEKGLLLKGRVKNAKMQNLKGYLPIGLGEILDRPSYAKLTVDNAVIDARFGTLSSTISSDGNNKGIATAKILHSNPLNIKLGVARQHSEVVVMDQITGKTLGVLEGTHISNGRTAFYSVLAFDKFLSNRDAIKVFVNGSGAVAQEIVKVLDHHAGDKISSLVVCSPNSSQAFVDRFNSESPTQFPMKAIADNSTTDDLKEADFVITVTSNGKTDPPVFASVANLKEDAVVLSLGANEQPEDFLEDVMKNGVTVCDTIENVSGRAAQALALYFIRRGKTLKEEAKGLTVHEIFDLDDVQLVGKHRVLVACSGLASMDGWYAAGLLKAIARARCESFDY